MGESSMFSLADRLLDKLGSAALEEIGLAWGMKKEMKKLEDTLVTIRAVLLDAEDQLHMSRELKAWMGRLQDACYQADDIHDDLEIVVLKHKLTSGSFAKKVCYFFSSLNPIAFSFKMGHKIKEVREKLDLIAADRSKFHLIEKVVDRTVVQRDRDTHSFLSTSDVVGREKEKQDVIKLLMDSHGHHNVHFIPIVGIGGLGKTTVARMVYNERAVIDHFELRLWVCVSEEFDVKRLIENIVKSADNRSCVDLNVEQLQVCLRELLNGKRFLLVLDDLWNDNRVKWVEFSNLLMGGGHGSKVIVTTRRSFVASMVGTIPTYNLEGLPQEECLTLFVRWAFKQGQELQNPNLMKIGEGIVKKCKGVPLAVRTLGSLLFMKTDEREWVDVRENEIWQLEQYEGDILPALKLSYNGLPSHLKRCFAFCSVYPKDTELRDSSVIYHWMAHDLIQPSKQAPALELEKIGEQYVRDLQSRSFFQDVVDYTCCSTFKMHDLVHDLALLVAQTEYSTVNFHVQNVSQTTRHLSFNDDKPFPDKELPSCLLELKNLRTVYLQFDGPTPTRLFVENCISKFKLLRTLDLRYSCFEVLPSSIGSLRHLRLLTLSYNRSIKALPNSLCQLQSLQTFGVHRCEQLQKLPRDFSNLISLRCLYLTTQERCLLGEGIARLTSLRLLHLKACVQAECLSDRLLNLTALQTLEIHECKNLVSLPARVRHLTKLEVLYIRNCEKLELNDYSNNEEDEAYDSGSGSDVGGGLMSLRYLGLYELPKLVALPLWLLRGAKGMGQRSLTLTALQTLEIVRCESLVHLPLELRYLTTLESIRIRSCKKLEIMEEFGGIQGDSAGLKNLSSLVLRELPKLVALPRWLLQDSTATLKQVDIDDLPNLTSITLLKEFKSLKKLRIVKCPQVTSLPEGMSCLDELDGVSIRDCPKLIRRCQPRTGEDWHKIAYARSIYLDGVQIKN